MGTPELDVPYESSLCHTCAARRYVQGRATLFVLCGALETKYPPQPVRRCAAFTPRDVQSRAPRGDGE
jgi:hypothetical protein